MSVKKRGADTIFLNAEKGTLLSAGTLDASGLSIYDGWYQIKSLGAVSSLPANFAAGQIFKTPRSVADAITLAPGDEVWPLTLKEICKGDIEISAESGVIEATDSCDYPYDSNILDGFTNLSGSINTMLRFDAATNELTSVATDYLNKFFDVVDDDGEGTYTLYAKDDSQILMMILMNRDSAGEEGMVENWWLIPAILSGASTNAPLKEILGADYSWSKGEGPATLYKRTVPAES